VIDDGRSTTARRAGGGTVYGALAVACLLIGLLHLLRLAVRRPDPAVEAGYATMALGMAGMFSPLGDPVPAPVWVAAFLLGGAWFAALALRAGTAGVLGGEAVHLAIGSGAMLFMLGRDAQAGGTGGGHAAHGGGAPELVGVASAVALVLAAYFVLHTMRCADRLRADRLRADRLRADPLRADPLRADRPGPDPAGVEASGVAVALRVPAVCSTRTAALAHLAMTGSMAIMLVGMI
jgi:hypothetical protein